MRVRQFVKDAVCVIGFYALGALTFARVEHWTFFQSIYFISSTVSTVGYGDLTPTTAGGQLYCCVMIVVGVTLVFTTFRKYIFELHEAINSHQERFSLILGGVDVDALPIYKYSPEEVEAMTRYSIKYFLALLPMLSLLAFLFVVAACFMELSVVKAVYFTVVTCTTVGYGDYHAGSGGTRAFLSVFLVVLCLVVTKTGSDMYHINVRRRIRRGESQPDIETMLLRKARAMPHAKFGYSVSESEYIVEALLKEKLVDRRVLLAVRRRYHWVSSADGCRTDITAIDLYEQHRLMCKARHHASMSRPMSLARRAFRRAQSLARRVSSIDNSEEDNDRDAASLDWDVSQHPDNETFDEWRRRYWDPKVLAAQAAGRQEAAPVDPFAVERTTRSTRSSIAPPSPRPTIDGDATSAEAPTTILHGEDGFVAQALANRRRSSRVVPLRPAPANGSKCQK
ncbi:hypothetical protein CTAYLR_008911 [Chrysophaeum taylorii]|uniref:Potassium channel domain-containing protein n=1 Tax=Chrysophaeum taylorii TaxID=2483200 RepID=A0AAD7XJG1_9STRA|nr:hypothetical protein CTAYLR_008911 [Chrysophaeum taylorii]